MVKYLVGSVLVLLLAAAVVFYMVKRPGVAEKVDAAAIASKNGVKNADVRFDTNTKQYFLTVKDMDIFADKNPGSTKCTVSLDIFFDSEKNAKTALKNVNGLPALFTKPMKGLSPMSSTLTEEQDKLIEAFIKAFNEKYSLNSNGAVLASIYCGLVR